MWRHRNANINDGYCFPSTFILANIEFWLEIQGKKKLTLNCWMSLELTLNISYTMKHKERS